MKIEAWVGPADVEKAKVTESLSGASLSVQVGDLVIIGPFDRIELLIRRLFSQIPLGVKGGGRSGVSL